MGDRSLHVYVVLLMVIAALLVGCSPCFKADTNRDCRLIGPDRA